MVASRSFLEDICVYVGDNTDFYYGDGSLPAGQKWLKSGEIQRNVAGVYAVSDPSPAPEPEDGVMYFGVSFWAINPSTEQAYEDLQSLYDLFFGNHDFPTQNFYVFQSFLAGQISDGDRTEENNKVLVLSAIFTVRYLIS